MVEWGRSVPDGALPVFSVSDEEEAKELVVLACGTNMHGQYIADELVMEQTLDNLELFSARMDKFHDVLVAHGFCRCSGKKLGDGLLTKRKKKSSVRGMTKAATVKTSDLEVQDRKDEKFPDGIPAMCYVAVEEGPEREREIAGWYLGICKWGEPGYHRYTRRNRPFKNQAEAEEVAKSQNALLGLTEKQAALIVASTMRSDRSVAREKRSRP